LNKDLDLWKLAKECLETGIQVTLLQVLESSGSSPGRQGFRMVVCSDGRMAGSIGGGIMEHKLVELARHRMQEGETTCLVKTQIHKKEAPKNQSGMICSGEQTIAFRPLEMEDLKQVIQIISILSLRQRVRIYLSEDEFDLGYPYEGGGPRDIFVGLAEGEDTVFDYQENIGIEDTLYIIGGGHVGLAFSKLMAMLDFNLVLVDDRPGLNTVENNQWAHRKLTADYTDVASLIPAGPNTYIAIMTFGYRPDKVALTALLGREYAYLGLMGSESKIAHMWKEFREEGVSEEELARVHSPIGLPIHSRTPEEIAVSIAAQIIYIRNQPFGDAR
jgi:xanthine dehydrogenase accessory factor